MTYRTQIWVWGTGWMTLNSYDDEETAWQHLYTLDLILSTDFRIQLTSDDGVLKRLRAKEEATCNT